MFRLVRIVRARTPWTLVVLLGLVAALAGCTGETPAGGEEGEAVADATGAALPDWLVRVYPEPGAELSGNQEVQLEYTVDESSDQVVRLLIDGTDLTIHSDVTPGELSYDPEVGTAPLELDSGEHTATAELVEVSDSGEETVDTFEWTFNVL